MKSGIPRWTRGLAVAAATLALCVAATAAAAQGTAGARGEPDAEGADQYRVGSGDALRVDVSGRSDLSGSYTVVGGAITIPVVGAVRVEGRTLSEIGSDLTRRISLFDRSGPQVTVAVVEYRSRKVFVLGAVLMPGIYSFGEMPNVWEAIAEAGGPLEEADLSRVEIIPGDADQGRKTVTLDVGTEVRQGRSEALPRLRPGETVRVPRGQGATSVLLFGAVERPGALPYEQAPDLVTALMRGGGPTVDAKLSRVEIIRHTGQRLMRLRVNLDDYFLNASPAGNPRLEPGDTVYLPREASRRLGFLTYVTAATTLVGLVSSIVILSN